MSGGNGESEKTNQSEIKSKVAARVFQKKSIQSTWWDERVERPKVKTNANKSSKVGCQVVYLVASPSLPFMHHHR